MSHDEYTELRDQLKIDLSDVFVKIADCEKQVASENKRIDNLSLSLSDLKTEFAKSNTKLNIMIAILSFIATPIIGVCINFLFK